MHMKTCKKGNDFQRSERFVNPHAWYNIAKKIAKSLNGHHMHCHFNDLTPKKGVKRNDTKPLHF